MVFEENIILQHLRNEYNIASYYFYRLTRECVALQNHTQIQKLLKLIGGDFVSSHNPNTRKGALVGLAAIAIALGKVKPISNSAMIQGFAYILS